MRIHASHTLDDLERDLRKIATSAKKDLRRATRMNVRAGNTIARREAKEKAGPHGKNFYKRIGWEMTGPLEGEFGPEGAPKSDFVGVGYRTGDGNDDLDHAADVIGPRFARDVGTVAERLFWP